MVSASESSRGGATPLSRRPVVILGATGTVGQRFIQLLTDHPWFEIVGLAASGQSAGRRLSQACHWLFPGQIPAGLGEKTVNALDPDRLLPKQSDFTPIAFSALPVDVAREMEPRFAEAGFAVFSNASAFRYDPDIPLVVPEVNAEHLSLLDHQQQVRGWPGFIVTNPNCTTIGISIALKPLDVAFSLERASITSLQAVSGGGYPGISSLDILDNVVPFIDGEEEKIERETRLLLGRVGEDGQTEADILISAQANRVPVIDGHTVCLSLGFKDRPTVTAAIEAMTNFRGPQTVCGLPSAPSPPIIVCQEANRPQPRLDRDASRGMAVTVGRVRPCPLHDLRMVIVSHNTVRGAAGASVLNAELLVAGGRLR